ncbi:MAG: NAD(P)-dependent alcohol dehydrogenase [Chthoniobacteraceae bacterium]
MSTIKALAASGPKAPFQPFEYDPGSLGAEEVEVAVEYCGICHSDLSMLNNDWGMTKYPFVGGHEVIGKISAVGPNARGLKVGQRVGVGWTAESCMACQQCLSGDHHLCANARGTIVQRHGGFATHLRVHWAWAIPMPEGLDGSKVGPLFCGGITVFNPLMQLNIKPTYRVGVVGIGGLGHMALKFFRAWGCEVIAFTSSESKRDEALSLGAHRVVNSRNAGDIKKLAGSLNAIISTVNVTMDWNALIAALAPHGKLHIVGAVAEPISFAIFPLIMGARSISSSPTGSPTGIATMLTFAARHGIEPTTELYPMSKINEAFERLESGKARYRIVLQNDLN